MVAGLFAAHGVWVGTQDEANRRWNVKGTFENKALKELVRQAYGFLPTMKDHIAPPQEIDGFAAAVRRTIANDGYSGGPWLFKTSTMLYRAFAPLKPIYVIVRRATESVIRSYLRGHTISHEDLARPLHRRLRVLDALEARGALRVDSENLIAGNYAQIDDVFRRCGLTFDASKADRWIDRDLWHF